MKTAPITHPFIPYKESVQNRIPKLTPALPPGSKTAIKSEGYVEPFHLCDKIFPEFKVELPRVVARYQPIHYPLPLKVLIEAIPQLRAFNDNPMLAAVSQCNPNFANRIKYLTGQSKENYAVNLAGLCPKSITNEGELNHFLHFALPNPPVAYPTPIPYFLQTSADRGVGYNLMPYGPAEAIAPGEALAEWYRIPHGKQVLDFVDCFINNGFLVYEVNSLSFEFGLHLDFADPMETGSRERRLLGYRVATLIDKFNLPAYRVACSQEWSIADPVGYAEKGPKADPFYRGGGYDTYELYLASLGYVPDGIGLQVKGRGRVSHGNLGVPMFCYSLLMDYYPMRNQLNQFLKRPTIDAFSQIYHVNQLLKSGTELRPGAGRAVMQLKVSQELTELLYTPEGAPRAFGYEHLRWLYDNLIRFI